MMDCRAVDVDKAAISVLAALTMRGAKKGVVTAAGEAYQRMKGGLNLPALTHCLGEYISAELDSDTAGERGLGRLTTHVPRLGGHCRNDMVRLSENNADELHGLIQDLMLRGYVVNGVLVEKGAGMAKIRDGGALFEAWIPGIYSSDISEMGQNLRSTLAVCAEEGFAAVRAFLDSHGIRGGGFLSRDKTEDIVAYYPLAGFGLRTVETRGF